MRFRCSATFLFPPPEPFLGCGIGTTPGVILSIAPNTYWNLTSNTGPLPFTNSLVLPIQVGDVICVDGSGDIVSSFPCTLKSQFLVDGIPITNPFPACPQGGLTPELAQFLVNVYQVNPNATIKVNNLGATGTQVIITMNDGLNHTIAQLEVFFSDVPVFIFEAPFVCTIIKKQRAITTYQPFLCIPPDKLIGCPQFIRSTRNKQIYEFVKKDAVGNCCYQLFSRSSS